MVADRTAFPDSAVYMPVEQYLALDDTTDGLYEYWHGLVLMLRLPSSVSLEEALVDMAGGGPPPPGPPPPPPPLLFSGRAPHGPAVRSFMRGVCENLETH